MNVSAMLVLGIALAMDAFAVTISNSIAFASEPRRRLVMMPVLFGLFQGLMPLLGYFLGGVCGDLIETYSGIVALIILGIIGGNMVREGVAALRVGEPEESKPASEHLSVTQLLFEAVATAIDAFAVGVSLRAMGASIWISSLVIALSTFGVCIVGLALGKRVGSAMGDKAEILGGIVLICIGLKACVFPG